MMPNGSLEALTGTTRYNVGRRSRRLAPCGGRRPQFRSGQARVPTSRGHRNPFWAGHGHSHTTARLVEQPGTAGAREVSLDAPNCGPYQGNHAVSGSPSRVRQFIGDLKGEIDEAELGKRRSVGSKSEIA
jgi:hypothetical protein